MSINNFRKNVQKEEMQEKTEFMLYNDTPNPKWLKLMELTQLQHQKNVENRKLVKSNAPNIYLFS